jgi:branched-chain amino acid transport system substrate-binding protein
MKKSRFFIGLTVIGVLLLGFAGCGKEKVEKVKIGGIFALSGGAAAYGEDIRQGAMIALEEFGKPQGINIELLVQDSKSDKTEAIKLAEQLINVDRVIAIYGPTTSPNAIAVGQLCDQYKVPMVTAAATQDEVTVGADYIRKYVTRTCFNDSFQGWALAKFAIENLKKKKAIIIYDKSVSYSVGLAGNFKKAFIARGGAIVTEESYSVKDVDFSPLIDKIAKYNAEVLFIPGWDENVGPMLKQSGQKWNKFTLLGGDGWPTDKLLELSGGNVGHAFALGHYAIDTANPIAQKFNASYKAKWGRNPTPHAALGYDSMMLICNALKRCLGDLTRERLNSEIKSTKDLELATGSLTIEPSGDVKKNGVILEVTPTGFKYYGTIAPEK